MLAGPGWLPLPERNPPVEPVSRPLRQHQAHDVNTGQNHCDDRDHWPRSPGETQRHGGAHGDRTRTKPLHDTNPNPAAAAYPPQRRSENIW